MPHSGSFSKVMNSNVSVKLKEKPYFCPWEEACVGVNMNKLEYCKISYHEIQMNSSQLDHDEHKPDTDLSNHKTSQLQHCIHNFTNQTKLRRMLSVSCTLELTNIILMCHKIQQVCNFSSLYIFCLECKTISWRASCSFAS